MPFVYTLCFYKFYPLVALRNHFPAQKMSLMADSQKGACYANLGRGGRREVTPHLFFDLSTHCCGACVLAHHTQSLVYPRRALLFAEALGPSSPWFIHGECCCLLRLRDLTVSCPKDVSPWLFITQCLCLHLDFNLNVVSFRSLTPAGGVSLLCILCLYKPVAFIRLQLSVSWGHTTFIFHFL